MLSSFCCISISSQCESDIIWLSWKIISSSCWLLKFSFGKLLMIWKDTVDNLDWLYSVPELTLRDLWRRASCSSWLMEASHLWQAQADSGSRGCWGRTGPTPQVLQRMAARNVPPSVLSWQRAQWHQKCQVCARSCRLACVSWVGLR